MVSRAGADHAKSVDTSGDAADTSVCATSAGGRKGMRSALPTPKLPRQAGDPLTARTRLPILKPGAYRVRLEAEDAAGQTARSGERTYWFDGKAFEEL